MMPFPPGTLLQRPRALAPPRGAAIINPADPINAGLLAAWMLGGHLYDLRGAHAPLSLQSGTGVSLTYAGLGLATSASHYATTTVNAGLGGSFTMWCMGLRSGAGGTGDNTIMASNVASYTNYWASLGVDSGGSLVNFALFDGTNNPSASAGASTSSGLVAQIAGVRDTKAGTIAVYNNGIFMGSTGDTTTSVPSYSTLSIGTQSTIPATRFWNGTIVASRIWSRALNAGEIARLYAEPWGGLLFPSDDISMIKVAGAGASPCRSRTLLGIGCGIALAKKIEENPIIRRRAMFLPWE